MYGGGHNENCWRLDASRTETAPADTIRDLI